MANEQTQRMTTTLILKHVPRRGNLWKKRHPAHTECNQQTRSPRRTSTARKTTSEAAIMTWQGVPQILFTGGKLGIFLSHLGATTPRDTTTRTRKGDLIRSRLAGSVFFQPVGQPAGYCAWHALRRPPWLPRLTTLHVASQVRAS